MKKMLLNEQTCPVRSLKHNCRMSFVYSTCVEYLLLYGRILSSYSVFLKVTLNVVCKFATVNSNHQDQGLGLLLLFFLVDGFG